MGVKHFGQKHGIFLWRWPKLKLGTSPCNDQWTDKNLTSFPYKLSVKIGKLVNFLVCRPATAPAQRQENVRREFSLDIDGIEGDDVHHDVTVPTLEANDALDDLISAPVKKPYTK